MLVKAVQCVVLLFGTKQRSNSRLFNDSIYFVGLMQLLLKSPTYYSRNYGLLSLYCATQGLARAQWFNGSKEM